MWSNLAVTLDVFEYIDRRFEAYGGSYSNPEYQVWSNAVYCDAW